MVGLARSATREKKYYKPQKTYATQETNVGQLRLNRYHIRQCLELEQFSIDGAYELRGFVAKMSRYQDTLLSNHEFVVFFTNKHNCQPWK